MLDRNGNDVFRRADWEVFDQTPPPWHNRPQDQGQNSQQTWDWKPKKKNKGTKRASWWEEKSKAWKKSKGWTGWHQQVGSLNCVSCNVASY